jgi:hypothetical protein
MPLRDSRGGIAEGSTVVLFLVGKLYGASMQTRRGIRMADETAKWITPLT